MLYNRCAGNMVNDEMDEMYCLDSGLSGINWRNFYKANTIMSNPYKRENCQTFATWSLTDLVWPMYILLVFLSERGQRGVKM